DPPRIEAPPIATAATDEYKYLSPHHRNACPREPGRTLAAGAALVPEMTYVITVTREVATPENCATVRFVPRAYRWRPNAVQVKTMVAMATSASHRTVSAGIGPTRPVASDWIAGGAPAVGAPFV